MHKLEQSWKCKSARYNGSLNETSDYRCWGCWGAYGLMGLCKTAICKTCAVSHGISPSATEYPCCRPDGTKLNRLNRHVVRWNATLKRCSAPCTACTVDLPCFARAAFHLNPGLDGHLRRTEDREAGRPEAMGQRGRESYPRFAWDSPSFRGCGCFDVFDLGVNEIWK